MAGSCSRGCPGSSDAPGSRTSALPCDDPEDTTDILPKPSSDTVIRWLDCTLQATRGQVRAGTGWAKVPVKAGCRPVPSAGNDNGVIWVIPAHLPISHARGKAKKVKG
jgi:hypothetical protein